jgi:quercetin dioxygenase-like cupin family protein
MKKIKLRPVTARERLTWPKDVIVKLEKAFVDLRGSIQPLVDLPMESAVLIHSKKGAVRANHYHQTDWHFCYVLSGSIEYLHRPTGSRAKPKTVFVKEGELFFTPPMVDHQMVFPEDASFLVLGRNSRAQPVYEADVVRIPPLRK